MPYTASAVLFADLCTCQSFDTLNNVEQVTLSAAGTARVTVSVIGANVPQGPQPYALVVSGALNASAPCGGVCQGTCESCTPLLML
jgi:hypothetical protein